MAGLVSNPRILVTGATGFIGTPLCARLQELGHPLTALTRDPSKARKRLGEQVELVTKLDDLGDATFGGVINLAGEPLAARRWNERLKAEIRRSRIGTTEALFEYFQRVGDFPEVLVNGSGIGVYGNQGDRPITEGSNLSDDSFSSHLCRDWEAAAERFTDRGTRVCRIRTGVVLGPDGGALQAMLPAFKFGVGGRLGDGRQWMSWIHRRDLIGIILLCLSNSSLVGPVNGTAPNPVTNRVFTRTLAKTLHRPSLLPVPGFGLRLLMGELADELLLAGQRVLPEVAPAHGYEYEFPELGPALEDVLHTSRRTSR
ncbi:TIGR01777 family oxidoreductase [Marinimicrobium sp. ABcell2]|uniref:TIGR01777 family oxidoreductase n=1 Tax=Marinimicrobium sp. ABcell2 TaxID=3069751 RepID=UPI0027B84A06|nr:TIGR01777 family oxidoreductase [Marinimicrobium sp. ABcell2]MDQ2077295.1 TIGR01777 family oxidoreductase [Marinimicrobium sp. ABcell2]